MLQVRSDQETEDCQADPARICGSAMFVRDASVGAIEWGWIEDNKLNQVLSELLDLLRLNMPLRPREFLLRSLMGRPLRVGGAEIPSETMGLSETMRCWGDVRRIVFGAPSVAGREALVTTLLDPLFEKGFAVDAAPYGYPLLHVACAQGNTTVVKAAAAHGANLHERSRDGLLAIELAAAMGHYELVMITAPA